MSERAAFPRGAAVFRQAWMPLPSTLGLFLRFSPCWSTKERARSWSIPSIRITGYGREQFTRDRRPQNLQMCSG
ncbi:uncharacterized protein SCHCODRAFT_01305321 [Schizophyllum commune H4-8]|uniref:uncharacterized protein n=1 Tax=Schizophyllum commune (strain H4-8 / FGSC 9210) TaxID=578458 RepID=UPI002160249B|nr:uncharacterized protein SCHCODRAFT_01305321 [Schizophyllum commune H4-8]KAI5892886.1 hypothetical protein SCHCODRAFT_01305321 [Schizophyllum commune H4-8]